MSFLGALTIIVGALLGCTATAQAGAPHGEPRLRRPVAMVLTGDENWLFVANRRSGTVSSIDCRRREVVAETAVGRALADLKAAGEGRLAAVDEQTHELVLLRHRGAAIEVSRRIAVAPYPVSLTVSPDRTTCFVASLWPRKLTIVDLRSEPPRVEQTLSLPFAPRGQIVLAGGEKLLVADAFGGRLALVDVACRRLECLFALEAHNIRGLAATHDGATLLVAHQVLDPAAPTTNANVHWGALATDVLRWIAIDELLADGAGPRALGHVHQFGDADGAGGDPAGLAVAADGTAVQTLAGVGRLALAREWGADLARIEVGRRPTAVVLGGDGRTAYVADTFGDAVAVVDLAAREKIAEVTLGAQPELSAADRGELLFYDARLSLDGWYSCHSCHTDGHTNRLAADNFSDGSYGTPKQVPSLLGVGETGPWAWNGAATQLESQVRKSIATTMRGPQRTDDEIADLTAYLRSLPPPPADDSLGGERDRMAAARGRDVFDRLGCAACHAPPTYTSAGVYDVGLHDERGVARFNPPSLRGVGRRGPYLHDNRAATLEDVFSRHAHQTERPLSAGDLEELVSFLRGL